MLQASQIAAPSRTRTPMLYALMVASGFAGLGYEMVWTQMLAVALGHEAAAVLAVLAAFFGGIALGAWGLQKTIWRSARPARLYALLELVIGVWALALVALIPAFNDVVFRALGDTPSAVWHWVVAFVGTFVLLLPATAAMGATLPAMERVLAGNDGPKVVGGLYAANTFGAMLGTVAGTFVLARAFGFSATLALLAAINLGCAALVLAASPHDVNPSLTGRNMRSAGAPDGLVWRLALTGLLGLGYEVVAIRVLAQLLENTVFTFASLLATYLLGTAIGAAVYQRRADKQSFDLTFRRIVIGLLVTSLAGTVMLAAAPGVHGALVNALGNGMVAGVAGEWIVSLLVFLGPTLFMGASFAHLAQASRESLGVGRAVAINTLGAAAAPIVFGVCLVPLVGSKVSLLIISLAYVALLPGGLRASQRTVATAIAAVVLVGVLPLTLRMVSVPDGGQVLSFVEGRMANVAVVDDATGTRFLKVNNQYTMGSSNSRFSDRRQAHIPLLLHPEPRAALFLGLGTGSTFAATSVHPDLKATAVELLPELVTVLDHFGPFETEVRDNQNLAVVAADARRFVASTDQRFDVIVADVFHPARDGAAALYTSEHFAAIRERLDEDGLFCQWLPLFQLDLPTLSSIVATFLGEFPHAQMHLAHFSLGQPIVGLVGGRQPLAYTRDVLARRLTDGRLAEDLASVRLVDDFALFGGFLAGPDALRDFAHGAPINTDNHPVVAWAAPRFLFAAPEPAYVRLLALIDALQPDADDFFVASQDAQDVHWRRRFAAYWQARDQYLRVGIDVTLTNDTRRMLEQIGQPLMQLVELSADFSPAYLPLLHMAIELSGSDPLVSRALLRRLEQAAPDRPEATVARQRLFPEPRSRQ